MQTVWHVPHHRPEVMNIRDPWLFETDRLVLRPWDRQIDLEDAFRIYSDPEIVRHIGGEARRIKSREEMLVRLDSIMKVRTDGLGRWAMERKSDRRVVGTIILQHVQEGYAEPLEEIEIGWHLARDAWGQGYASEAARALLRHGFEDLRITEILAVLGKENVASARVAQRIGMKRIGETDRYYGPTVELFRLTESEYRSRALF